MRPRRTLLCRKDIKARILIAKFASYFGQVASELRELKDTSQAHVL